MMGKKKYILEVEEDPTTIRLVKLKNGEDGLLCMQFMAVSPYKYDEAYQSGVHDTAKEIEAIKDEAYKRGRKDATDAISSKEQSIADKAYQSGLSDAWDAVTKIATIPYSEEEKVFGSCGWNFIRNHTASEAIAKLKQYEQEKEEEIRVGDEVRNVKSGWTAVVARISDDECLTLMDGNGAIADGYEITRFTKTGRHFTEIIELLRKMKEG